MFNVTVRRLPDGEELVLTDARPLLVRQDDSDRVRIRRPGALEPPMPRPAAGPRPRAAAS